MHEVGGRWVGNRGNNPFRMFYYVLITLSFNDLIAIKLRAKMDIDTKPQIIF